EIQIHLPRPASSLQGSFAVGEFDRIHYRPRDSLRPQDRISSSVVGRRGEQPDRAAALDHLNVELQSVQIAQRAAAGADDLGCHSVELNELIRSEKVILGGRAAGLQFLSDRIVEPQRRTYVNGIAGRFEETEIRPEGGRS